MAEADKDVTRRHILKTGICGAACVALGGGLGFLGARSTGNDMVWQIDPNRCIQCGNCKTNCVLQPSAVKCVHAITICGYCELCFGYFEPDSLEQTTGAENQLCPMAAISRKHVIGPYHEYTIDEANCIACGKCAKNCNRHGNGSLYLQVRHDRCLNCSQCSIAEACPSEAFVRLPKSDPYIKPKVAADKSKRRDETS